MSDKVFGYWVRGLSIVAVIAGCLVILSGAADYNSPAQILCVLIMAIGVVLFKLESEWRLAKTIAAIQRGEDFEL